MKRYRVNLTAIEWDDGKGVYDVSGLSQSAILSVNGEDENDAIETALDSVCDLHGSLIVGCSAKAREE